MRRVFQLLLSALVECSNISKTYYLDLNTLGDTPVFSRQIINRLISRAATASLPEIIQLQANTTSFIIKFDCSPPFGDRNPSETCQKVLRTFVRAAKSIERNILIVVPITIDASYFSFCPTPYSSSFGTPCIGRDSTLGRASPVAMHIYNNQSAQDLGLDSEYGYPTSLARQYSPSDFSNFNKDIVAEFNSDFNWYIEQQDPIWGKTITINGGFLNQSDSVSYDLEQVSMHEFLHGMGFISSWGNWLNSVGTNSMLPSYVNRDFFGNVLGLLPPWIFCKTMSDGINNVWLSSYGKLISKQLDISISSGNLNTFVNTTAYKTAQSLQSLFSTRNGILFWYPARSTNRLTYSILNTPNTFQPGSSLSHLDHDFYNGATIMGPFAQRGIKLNDMIPGHRNYLDPQTLGILRTMGYVVLY